MASFEQKIVAEVVRERGRKLLKRDDDRSKKELEAERLYFWIISRFAYEMEETYPAKKSFKMTIEEKVPVSQNGEIHLRHGLVAEYHSQYIFGNEFNDVLTRVKCTLNSMDGYHAYVLQPHGNKQQAILIVSMEL